MAYNEKLINRFRDALVAVADVQETKMKTGALFMVDGKVCVTVKDDISTFRIDPALHDAEVQRKGSTTMEMKGKPYRGYIDVTEEGLSTKKDFTHWLNLALAYNKVVKAAKKK